MLLALACSDPRPGSSPPPQCPDLIVDPQAMSDWVVKTATFQNNSCAVIEGEVAAGKRRLLRFSTATPNKGPGALIVGNPNNHPELFDFNTCHGHPHFKEYADYRLWKLADYTNWRALRDDRTNSGVLSRDLINTLPAGSNFVEGAKRGFCVVDNSGPYSFPDVTAADPRTFTSCSNQGISVGWADRYSSRLDGQWIDVTNVTEGTYILEVEVNAERLFVETEYLDNSAAITVQVPPPKGPQLTATSTSPDPVNETLSADQVQPLLIEAFARWNRLGLATSSLNTIGVRIADLPGSTLGLASGNTVWIDANAAGWGWFVDATPGNDSEFYQSGDQGEQGRMDLLTAVAHELGHLLGYEHSDDGLMADTLATGERHMPSTNSGMLEPILVDLVLFDKKKQWLTEPVASDRLHVQIAERQ